MKEIEQFIGSLEPLAIRATMFIVLIYDLVEFILRHLK